MEDIEIDVILGYIDHIISNYSTNIRLNKSYVFGSYGAKSQTRSSDLDIIVGVKNAEDEEIDDLQSIFKYSNDSVLIDEKLDVVVVTDESVEEYIRKACRMSNYETVYNVRKEEYIRIENI